MRCDEIREQILDFIYDDDAASQANAEISEHLRTCSACRKELEELKQARQYLRHWKDESPAQSVRIPGNRVPARQFFGRQYLRYAAIAAMALICFMALANTQIRLNKEGFSFQTHLFHKNDSERNYYTKTELRNLMKQALDDSEFRMSEANYWMMQKILDTVDQDRSNDLRLVRSRDAKNFN
jgi:hypothetical protein